MASGQGRSFTGSGVRGIVLTDSVRIRRSERSRELPWTMRAVKRGSLLSRVASRRDTGARILWAVAATSLFFSMSLAALYGLRYFIDVSWLDIPCMRALHGTANALGFAVAGLSAWLWTDHGGR